MAKENITKACKEANELRKHWGLSMRPARELASLAAKNDVLVFHMSLESCLSGAFVRDKHKRSDMILVNTNAKSIHHQRFTLAHEIGHLCLHKDIPGKVESVEPGDGDPIEQEAHSFSAELLAPLREVDRICKCEFGLSPDKITNPHVIELAGIFGINHQSILWRLRILSKNSPEEIRELIRTVDWHELWRKYDPEGFKDTQPQQDMITWQPAGVSKETARIISRFPDSYRRKAFAAYEKGLITSGKLAEILDLPDNEVVNKELQPLLRPDLLRQQEELNSAFKNAMTGNTDGQD